MMHSFSVAYEIMACDLLFKKKLIDFKNSAMSIIIYPEFSITIKY